MTGREGIGEEKRKKENDMAEETHEKEKEGKGLREMPEKIQK